MAAEMSGAYVILGNNIAFDDTAIISIVCVYCLRGKSLHPLRVETFSLLNLQEGATNLGIWILPD
jgi:hypothetical protein